MLVKDKFHVTCLSLDWGCLLFWCFINISHKFLNRAWEAGVKSVAYPWDESHIRCVRNQCNAWCIGLDYGKKIREFWAENSLQNTNLQIIIFQLSICCLKVKTPFLFHSEKSNKWPQCSLLGSRCFYWRGRKGGGKQGSLWIEFINVCLWVIKSRVSVSPASQMTYCIKFSELTCIVLRGDSLQNGRRK